MEGVTVNETLVPRTGPDPQPSANHSYVAPEPSVPPVAVSVIEFPSQTEPPPVMEVGAVGGVSKEILVELDSVNGPVQNPAPPVTSTVYVPACDCKPNEILLPVPATAEPTEDPFNNN